MAESYELDIWPSGGLRLFGCLRAAASKAALAVLVRSPIKLVVLISTWSTLLIGLYAISYYGIRFVNETAGIGPFLLSRLWFLFLFVVMIMLAVSQLASAYSTLVRAMETRFWMSMPVSPRALSRIKWLESSFYSAWAVVILVLPVCAAYMVVLKKHVLTALGALFVFFIPLLGIITALSTLVLVLWLRYIGRVVIKRGFVITGLVLAAMALFWLLGEHERAQREDVWFLALQDLLPRMRLAMSMYFPSSWAASALDAAINYRWIETALYGGLLWTSCLVCWRLLDHISAKLLFTVLREHAQPGAISSSLDRIAKNPEGATNDFHVKWWARRWLSTALAKDILLVIRDPVQWSQAIVFFGLLGAYFANMHRLSHMSVEPSWRMGVASLNLACTLLVFGSLAVRFIFPQMSVEGKSLWLMRITPGGMRKLLCAKLFLYSIIAVCIIETLQWISAIRLGIPIPIRFWLAWVGVLAGISLVGLTVGLGSWLIDINAVDAAHVVSSSNGALVLVLMLCYVGAVIAALVNAWGRWFASAPKSLVAPSLWLLVVSAITCIIPVLKGLHTLNRLEYAK